MKSKIPHNIFNFTDSAIIKLEITEDKSFLKISDKKEEQ